MMNELNKLTDIFMLTSSSRKFDLGLDVVGIVLVIWLVMLNFFRFDYAWDALAYHLPFAALRIGLIDQDHLRLRADLMQRFEGFPPLADFLQGLLWRVSGRPESTTVLAPISVLTLACYARAVAGLPLFWPVAIVLAIPTTHIALASANVDIWTNSLFCIFLLAAWRLLRRPENGWLKHTLIAAGALWATVMSKTQFSVVGPIALAILLVAEASLSLRASALERTHRLMVMGTLVVLAPMMFYWPLHNAIKFGNPVYPVTVALGNFELPGFEPSNYVGPAALAGLPQMARYVLSQLDLDAIGLRPHGFAIDQGYVPAGSNGDRMGGSLSVFTLAMIGSLAIAWRRRWPGRSDHVAAFAALALIAVVANIPQSHELRYFCFVNIMASVAAVLLLRANRDHGDTYSAGVLASLFLLICASAAFTGLATGLQTLTLRGTQTIDEVLRQRGVDGELASAREVSSTLCYLRPDPFAILFSPLVNHSSKALGDKIIMETWPAECPSNSALIQ